MGDTGPDLFNFTSIPDGYRRYLQPAIFDPWASELLAFAPPARGDVVLDVASGTGAVAHAAASLCGPSGRVIASDVSPLMLAQLGRERTEDAAVVEPLESSADHLDVPDDSVDVAYCQQGLQFMPDRNAVMSEMLRVLRPGGVAGIAVWSDQVRPEPFASYARVLQEFGIPEPYPNAYDTLAVSMSERELEHLLTTAGFGEPVVRIVELALRWPEPRAAAFGITGSTYGPRVASLSESEQEALFAALMKELDTSSAVMRAVFGRGVTG